MDHYEIPKSPQTPLAVSALLEALESPVNPVHGTYERELRIWAACKAVRAAQAEDEYLSWQVAKPVDPRMQVAEYIRKVGAR